MGIFGSSRKRSNEAAAVITGAGSGIGAAFATELARRGGRVVCSDIDETAAQTTADGIVAAGGEALATRCDVAQLDDVIQLAKVSQDWLGGPPTVVINNAGVGAGGTAIGETEIDDWNWVLGINLWGPIHGCHVFAPILREAGYGGIINVASAAAFARGTGDGRLQRQQGRRAVAVGDTVRRTQSAPASTSRCCARRSSRPTSSIPAASPTSRHELGDRLMRWTGFSPERVARTCLDTLDRGGLYCMPQPDARIGWGIKRFTPTVYTRAAGLSTRRFATQ